MPYVNIERASKLTGKSRSTISRYLKSGRLSRTPDGIDVSELSRVFGELKSGNDSANESKQDDALSEREKILMSQIDGLQKDKAWLQDRIVNLENRLDAPKKFKLW